MRQFLLLGILMGISFSSMAYDSIGCDQYMKIQTQCGTLRTGCQADAGKCGGRRGCSMPSCDQLQAMRCNDLAAACQI